MLDRAQLLLISVLALSGCAGSVGCPDADGDGYDACLDAPEDCDDLDVAVHPEAAEICDDGIDNDCSGGASDEIAEGQVPSAAASPPTVLTEADTCGFWLVPLDDHLVLDLHVHTELPECVLSTGPGLADPNDAIYTNLEGDGPKYTYYIVAEAVEEETTIDATCDEGTTWHALITVE